jgi:hypothetical protein
VLFWGGEAGLPICDKIGNNIIDPSSDRIETYMGTEEKKLAQRDKAELVAIITNI